jgi:hypothetical protein
LAGVTLCWVCRSHSFGLTSEYGSVLKLSVFFCVTSDLVMDICRDGCKLSGAENFNHRLVHEHIPQKRKDNAAHIQMLADPPGLVGDEGIVNDLDLKVELLIYVRSIVLELCFFLVNTLSLLI